jgi:hypothetical protein
MATTGGFLGDRGIVGYSAVSYDEIEETKGF